MTNKKDAIYNKARLKQLKLDRLGCKTLLTHLSKSDYERLQTIASLEVLRYSFRLTKRNITIDYYMSLLDEIFDWLDNNHYRNTTERLLDSIEESAIRLRESYPFLPAIPHFTRRWQVRDWRTSAKMALKNYICYVDETTKRVLWDADDPNYITVKEAAALSGGLFTDKTLGKRLRKKDNTIKWMNLRKRTKVQKDDLKKHIKLLKEMDKHRERISSQQGTMRANIQ